MNIDNSNTIDTTHTSDDTRKDNNIHKSKPKGPPYMMSLQETELEEERKLAESKSLADLLNACTDSSNNTHVSDGNILVTIDLKRAESHIASRLSAELMAKYTAAKAHINTQAEYIAQRDDLITHKDSVIDKLNIKLNTLQRKHDTLLRQSNKPSPSASLSSTSSASQNNIIRAQKQQPALVPHKIVTIMNIPYNAALKSAYRAIDTAVVQLDTSKITDMTQLKIMTANITEFLFDTTEGLLAGNQDAVTIDSLREHTIGAILVMTNNKVIKNHQHSSMRCDMLDIAMVLESNCADTVYGIMKDVTSSKFTQTAIDITTASKLTYDDHKDRLKTELGAETCAVSNYNWVNALKRALAIM
eukprot:5803-Heterococcus_DN1.PRE.1